MARWTCISGNCNQLISLLNNLMRPGDSWRHLLWLWHWISKDDCKQLGTWIELNWNWQVEYFRKKYWKDWAKRSFTPKINIGEILKRNFAQQILAKFEWTIYWSQKILRHKRLLQLNFFFKFRLTTLHPAFVFLLSQSWFPFA